ncbi:MAG: tetratricopeptide repeat protein, partial [Nannocystaceae bacterium]
IDPERRYPSMLALLGELEVGLRRGRRLRLIAAASLLALAAALVGVALTRPPALCTRAGEALESAWNDDLRTRAAAAFARTGRPFAAPAWAQVERRLDAYAEAWQAMHTDACAATHLRGEQSGDALDLRMRCLDRRRDELAALVALFVDADERAVLHAVEASDALTPIDRCADASALAAAQALPENPADRARALEVEAEIARAKALRDAGHYEEALEVASPALEASRELGLKALRADAGVMLGGIQALAGAPQDAAATLDQAFVDGLASGHTEAAAWAAIAETHVVGVISRRSADGRRWAHLAEPLLERLGRGDPRAESSLRGNLGGIAVIDGELAEAREHFEASLAITEAAYGPEDVMIAKMTANLATVHRRAGEHEEALAASRRAREVFTVNLGPEHPALATLANNVGVVLQSMGDLDGAERSYREVLAFAGGSLPETSSTLGHAHGNLGEVLLLRGRVDEAADHYRHAITIWEASRGPQHPLVAGALVGLATARIDAGAVDEALAALQRAIAIYTASDASAADLAGAQIELARAMALANPDELGEAIRVGEAAFAALPPGDAQARAGVWLEARRAERAAQTTSGGARSR